MSANKALRRLAARIKELKAEICELESQAYDATDFYTSQIYSERAESNRRMQRAEEDARRDREEATNRDYERQRVARELDQAVTWARITGGDRFGEIDRLTRKLSRGY